MFIQTDLPEPVAPAINKWGIVARSATILLPLISLPSPILIFNFEELNSSDCIISLSLIVETTSFGTSIPTRDFPGIGASILIPLVARANAISSERFKILLTLTPLSGSTSYLVTAGPFSTFLIVALTLKLSRVF